MFRSSACFILFRYTRWMMMIVHVQVRACVHWEDSHYGRKNLHTSLLLFWLLLYCCHSHLFLFVHNRWCKIERSRRDCIQSAIINKESVWNISCFRIMTHTLINNKFQASRILARYYFIQTMKNIFRVSGIIYF